MAPFQRLALFLAVLALATGCGSNLQREVGIVIAVHGDLASVDSFTVRTDDGRDLVLVPAAKGDFDFPVSHLRDHLVSLDPVEVVYETNPVGLQVAVAIRDG